MGIMTYKPSKDDSVLVFKNGGFGFNPLNSKAEKQIREKIKRISGLELTNRNTRGQRPR